LQKLISNKVLDKILIKVTKESKGDKKNLIKVDYKIDKTNSTK